MSTSDARLAAIDAVSALTRLNTALTAACETAAGRDAASLRRMRNAISACNLIVIDVMNDLIPDVEPTSTKPE